MSTKVKYYLILLSVALLYVGAAEQKPFTIFMIGDSTMADKILEKDKRERGWGMMMPEFLTGEVTVENHAVNGRSTKSFRSGGNWQKVIDKVKPGDYVFIQFGHNDAKLQDTARYAEAETAFRANLTRYVEETRAKGGKPVLFTSIVRRKFGNAGKLEDAHGRYVEVPREVAQQLNVPLVDLNVATTRWVEELGVEPSKRFFMWLKPGESLADVEGKEDNTHLVEAGAREVARMAAAALREKLPELAACIGFGLKNTARYYAPNKSTPAFPGAEGFGMYTRGGRGGKVIYVTNLNDKGDGSLREAVNAKGARTVLFKVSGNIELQSPLVISEGNLTIAGQSAPGDGITISVYPVKLQADQIVVRYLRFRLGDANRAEDDALSAARRKNIIIDHCSMSWSVDECGSFYNNESFTLQWCLLSESLVASAHAKGAHGYGGIWGGMGATFHHNLLAHHSSRNPRFCGARYHEATANTEWVDFRNNVIYNWGFNSSYAGENGQHNMVNNYYKPGAATRKSVKRRIVEAWQSKDRGGFHDFGKFYVEGNVVEGSEDVTADNWKGGVDFKVYEEQLGISADYSVESENYLKLMSTVRLAEPLNVAPVQTSTAHEAYESVLQGAGASMVRDAVDARVVDEVRRGTFTYGKNGLIDSPSEVGGLPALKTLPPPADTDGDGLPNAWEKAHSLNPNNAADGAQYPPNSDYTNLEIYLSSIELSAKS
ncbi:MAG: GDSL-type esterase/lipase family protein [Prevotellaceae bacterium]|jgi:lysophospholipase L1-like esterase/pectate lyase|nr:GDSL-type esterase/lipase family protein [Prevotellaceae bacterium]